MGFGEGECSFVFDGVLGGEDEEGFGKGVSGTFDGDLGLLHGFEEGGLGAGSGAVDFISEEDVDKDGAFDEGEFALFLIVDADPGDVVGEQVGGALDAFEIAS